MFIEAGFLKGAMVIFKGIPLILLAVYAMFFNRKQLTEIIHDDSFETTMDLLTVSLYSYCAYAKVFCGGLPIHTLCDALFFYIGGFTGLIWGFYKALNEINTYRKNKKEEKNTEVKK